MRKKIKKDKKSNTVCQLIPFFTKLKRNRKNILIDVPGFDKKIGSQKIANGKVCNAKKYSKKILCKQIMRM